jgi:hypothetical protein
MERTIQKIRSTAVFVIGVILLTGGATAGQSQFKLLEPVRPGGTVCDGAQIISGMGFNDNREAYQFLESVITAARLLPGLSGLTIENFDTRAANVDNVLACEDRNSPTRYILYNPQWVQGIMPKGGTIWVSLAILAHELGHHVLGHFIRGSPRSELEIEADEFAGKVLAHMQAPLSTFLEQYPCNPIGSRRHPPCEERRLALKRGYRSITRAGLGVRIGDDKVSHRLHLPGVLIIDVDEGSAAEAAGLHSTRIDAKGEVKLGDVIVAIDDDRRPRSRRRPLSATQHNPTTSLVDIAFHCHET